MVSYVAIDDVIRQKLEMLAVKFDTTQAEIIRRAIWLFEMKEVINQEQIPPRVKKELEKATALVYKNNPRRKRIIDTLNKPGIDIDDLRITLSE